MTLKVYNTLSRKKEEFVPLKGKDVKMYVCGTTAYDYSHIGHARSYVIFDVIRRFLEYSGHEVRYVQNFTDVDDKIIKRAKKLKVEPLKLAEWFIEEYFVDMDALGIKRADLYPKASKHISEIIEIIKTLMEKGFAYEVEENVYFAVDKVRGYGRLSHQSLKDMEAGARVEIDPKKRNPLDFTLWKKAKKGEVSWKSPWGSGRPGWHIECSAMSMKHLNETLDIHGGGQDLIFPHHENEIAQSEAYSGKRFARYWLHNGFVTVKGEKMSKSLGNFITVKDLLRRYDGDAIRFFLISTHYRNPLDFSYANVEEAKKGLERILNAIGKIEDAIKHASSKDKSFGKTVVKVKEDFIRAMNDDFNTPVALAGLFDFIREVNKYMENEPNKEMLERALKVIYELGGILGLKFEKKTKELTNELVELLIELREDARKRKDYETSDEIRRKLKRLGIILEDDKRGTKWKFR